MITVIDSPCGTGKTSWAIQEMNKNLDKKYIFITPFLDEIERVKENCCNRKFYAPNNKNEKGSKLEGLRRLLATGRDICMTHSLFQMIDDEIIEDIKDNAYTLILDEVMDVVELLDLSMKDYSFLINSGTIRIEKDNRVTWLDEDYIGKFEELKQYALSDNLYLHSRNNGDNKKTFLVWTFPCKVFTAFKDVFIMTYLFEGQIQRYYYDLYNIKYEYKSVIKIGEEYKLDFYTPYFLEDKTKLKSLIHIYYGDMNDIGNKTTALSKSWYKKNKSKAESVKRNCNNFFGHILQAKSNEAIWTIFKDDKTNKPIFRVQNYSRAFIPCNCRATNEYCDRWAEGYLVNMFMNPMMLAFFEDKHVEVNQDLWALSELIQWMFRGSIRKGEAIELYIPSSRMRCLLKLYLEGKKIG